jgi:hypothetical protein
LGSKNGVPTLVIFQMKNKNFYIIFGGSVNHYHDWFRVTYEIEKKLKIKLRRTNAEEFRAKKGNLNIIIRFCWNPVRDKNYLNLKEYQETEFKDIVAVPASELVKKLKNPAAVLFLGLCGGFKGDKSDVYVPEDFKEIIFEEKFIREKEILKIKPKNKIKIKNFMKGIVEGKPARVITSNLTLMPKNMENESEDILIKLTNHLLKNGDVVEKETYQIVKEFSKKCPLGVVLVASDVLTIKKHMLRPHKFKPNRAKLKNIFSNAVKEMEKKLR